MDLQESIDIEFFRKTKFLIKVVVPLLDMSEAMIESISEDEDSLIDGLIKLASHIVHSSIQLQIGDEARCGDLKFIITPEFIDELIKEEMERTIKYVQTKDITWN